MSKAVLQEWRINGERNIMDIVDKIANTYGLPPVSSNQLMKSQIKLAVKMINLTELWKDCYAISKRDNTLD